MASSIEYGQQLRHTKQVAEATKLVKKNIKAASPGELRLAVLHFEQLRWSMDRIPLTRDQRTDIDQMIVAIAKVLGNDNTP